MSSSVVVVLHIQRFELITHETKIKNSLWIN
jgi:hypothetical protein